MPKYLLRCACLFILLSLLLNRASSQIDFSLTRGPEINIDDGSISAFFDQDSTAYYFLKTNDKGYIEFNTGSSAGIEIFSHNLSHKASVPFLFSGEEKYRRLEPLAFYKTNEHFIILCKHYSGANQMARAFLFKAGPDGQIEDEICIPGEINELSSVEQDFHFFQLHRHGSADQPKFIFSLTTPPSLDIPERINFVLFDQYLHETGSRLINFPDDMLDYRFSKQVVTQQGQMFFRVEITNPFLPDIVVHQLIIYDILEDQHRSYEFKLERGMIQKLALQKLINNKVGIFGFYTNETSDEQPVGILYHIFDGQNGSLLRQNIHELSAEESSLFDTRVSGTKSSITHLEPQAIHITDDGNLFLLFEYNWRSLMLIQDQENKLYKKPVYKANEIVVLGFDTNEQTLNSGTLFKKQSLGIRQDNLGFFSLTVDERLVLLYNDHPKNIRCNKARGIKTMKTRYSAVIAEYAAEGDHFSKQYLNTKKNPLVFTPSSVFFITKDKYLILNKSHRYCLSRLSF